MIAQRRVTLFSFEQSANGVRASWFKTTPASSLLGMLDVETRTFRSIEGPRTSLGSFVQMPDGHTVYTLTDTARGSFLRAVDLEASTVRDLGVTGRDVALLPDGRIVLNRGTGGIA